LPADNDIVLLVVPVRVNVTFVDEPVLNRSAATPPDTIKAALLMIIGAELLNSNWVVILPDALT
jgi:hypothetical protein